MNSKKERLCRKLAGEDKVPKEMVYKAYKLLPRTLRQSFENNPLIFIENCEFGIKARRG